MGKGKRLKGLRKLEKSLEEEFSEKVTINFQKELRNSPLWDQMIAEFGEKRAEELLKECKGELKAGS